MPVKDLSVAAKIYLLSGKIEHLTGGFCFTKSPTGEMVNTQRLAEAMILATLLELVKDKKLEMRDESKKVLFMVSPIITLKRLGDRRHRFGQSHFGQTRPGEKINRRDC